MNAVSNNVGGENLWMQRRNVKRNASFHSHDDLILENIITEDEAKIRSGKFKHSKDIVSRLYFL